MADFDNTNRGVLFVNDKKNLATRSQIAPLAER